MSYTSESTKYGRIPTVFVELDMDFCVLRSGIGACTATQTGDAKCYNTYSTCNDKANFNKTIKTYRFCEQNADLPVGLSAIPLLKLVSFESQEITPNKGLGVRGSVSISFIDAPWPDTEIDPYWRERSYDTSNQGTFWGKFKARNPFYENRVLRVRRGYLTKIGFDWANFVNSVYVMEQLQGIAKDDSVKIVAKDILKLADDKKALFPKPSNGRLSASIDAVQTSFTLSPSGIGAEYKLAGKLAISGELMSYTRLGDTFTVVRGASNTQAEAHNAEDTAQEVGIFVGEKIQNVIYELLTTYSGISTSYIDKPAWDAEATAYLAGVWSAEIPEPTGINTLVGELTEQGTCRVWWDEIEQLIPFRAIKPLPLGLPILSDESHFLTKSIDAKTDTNQRISTVFIYFAQRLPTKKLDDLENYALRVATPNLEAISSLEYGSNLIKKIFSRWFKTTSQGRANALADALLKTYRDPPQIIEFSLTPALQLKVGDLFYAQTRKIQDVTGAIASVPMEIIYAQPTDRDDIKYKAQQVSTAIPTSNTFKIILSDSLYLDLNLYDAFVAEYGIPEAGISVEFEILADVLITASANNYAFVSRPHPTEGILFSYMTLNYALVNPANWPSNVLIKLTINNSALLGGLGGDGGWIYDGPNNNGTGQHGGHGIKIEYPITIDNQGKLFGGAGGGGAVEYSGCGGGGGAPIGQGGVTGGQDATRLFGGEGGYTSDIGSANGGMGGDLGQNGSDGVFGGIGVIKKLGGIAGDAIHGNSLITWVNTGTIYGNIVP